LRIVPAIGVRLMWTSKTLMKMETRITGSGDMPSSPSISSAGGGTVAIRVTMPSAGATISPSPVGVVRTGSRKKAAVQIVTIANSQPTTSQSITHQNKAVIAAAMTTNLRPSGWTPGIR
jgi:hypothetical protein